MKWPRYARAMQAYYDAHGHYPAFGATKRERAREESEEELSKDPSEAPPPRNPIQQARRTRRKHWK